MTGANGSPVRGARVMLSSVIGRLAPEDNALATLATIKGVISESLRKRE